MSSLTKLAVLLFAIFTQVNLSYAAAPTVVLTAPTGLKKDVVTFNGTVTAGGLATTAKFVYGQDNLFNLSTPDQNLVAADENKAISAEVSGLERGKFYQVKITATNTGGTTPSESTQFFVNNNPTPKDDDVVLEKTGPNTIDVLANDKDPDGRLPEDAGGDTLEIVKVTAGTDGTAQISPGLTKIIYTPAQNPKGFDTITYTVRDEYGGEGTAVLTIRSPKLALKGMQAFQLKNLDGTSAGLIRLIGTGNGSFTGKVIIGGKSYVLSGTLDANGKFRGTATGDDGTVSVSMELDQSADGTNFTAKVTQGNEVFESEAGLAELTSSRREEIAGKYTIEFPPPGSEGAGDGVLPQGIGFARVEVKEWGDVRIVGKLGDGGKFSTRGVVMGEGENAVLAFYAAPKNGRLNGELTFGAGTEPTLGGQLQWFHPQRDGANFFPDGFFVDVNPTGGRYIPPNKNDSAFGGGMESEFLTLTLSKGDLRTSITHRIQLGDKDSITILDPGRSDLQFKINRKRGTFNGQFTHTNDEENRKFQGVLIQSNQSGRGVFIGQKQTGSVELSVTSSPTTLPANGTGQ